MLVVRGKQFHTLSQVAMKTFVDRMAVHAGTYFPDRCRTLGEEAVRQWIELGIVRAGRYGIVAERDVCRYIGLMFELGRDYDQDPQFTRLQLILKDDQVKKPAEKIGSVYRELARQPLPRQPR